jgi:putative transcriptional regulator
MRHTALHRLDPPNPQGRSDQSERIGVTRQTVIAVEQGRYSPSLELAFQIARVFHVPLDEVFQYPNTEGETS